MSITLNPIERCSIAQFADKVGFLPVAGSVSGLARMVVSAVVGLFAALAVFATAAGQALVDLTREGEIGETSELTKKCEYLLYRSFDEATRGLLELIPFEAVRLDKARDKFAAFSPEAAYITNNGGAYGQYIYQTERGPLCYSSKKLEGTVTDTYYQGTEHEMNYEPADAVDLFIKQTTILFTPKA